MNADVAHPVPVRAGLVAALALMGAGCGDLRVFHKPGPPAEPPAVAGPQGEPVYTLACPDVLHVRLLDRSGFDVVAAIDVDSRVMLGDSVGSPPVGGHTLAEAKDLIARAAGTTPDKVWLALEDARTARVYLCGPVNNKQRPIPYQGPERVLDFLRRVGALQPGCTDVRDVSIVRPNVAAGEKTQVFHVDIEAIVLDNEPTSNLVVLPGDQVYVGETRRSSFTRLLPKWLRPLYRQLLGLLPPDPAFWWPWGR
jgi:protein involved in polysaccharide export with SLBB domain